MKAKRFDARLTEHAAANPDGCWIWEGAVNRWGYGQTTVGNGTKRGRTCVVHRESYERLVGAIPEGLQVDHLCRNRRCYNPKHLEPVSIAENVLRGEGPGAKNRRKTHCYKGHEFTPENTMIVSTTGERRCRMCDHEKQRAKYWKDPEAARARVREYWHSGRRVVKVRPKSA